MAAKQIDTASEHNEASLPCLIKILEKFGYRVFIIRRRLSRLKTRIEREAKKKQPTTTFESEKEGLLDEFARYEDLLNDCAEWIHVRTGIPTNKLVEIAISTAFTEGEDRDHIYAELRKLDERGVTAELWRALVLRDQDALVSVKLLSSEDGTSSLAVKNLQKCQLRAYRAFQFAESRLERQLEDREAWDYLTEHGIPKDHDDLQDLQSYTLPSLETFTTYLSNARRALGELKYEKGTRRQSKSVVKRAEID